MEKNRTFHKKKTVFVFACCVLMLIGLVGRLVYLMVFRSDYYAEKADDSTKARKDLAKFRERLSH